MINRHNNEKLVNVQKVTEHHVDPHQIKVTCYIWRDGALKVDEHHRSQLGNNDRFTDINEAKHFAEHLNSFGHRVKVYIDGNLCTQYGEHIVETYC